MIVFLLCMLTLSPQDTAVSDSVAIEGLGTVAFPPGDWELEYRSKPEANSGSLDCYVFKRKGERLERLTFQRFRPDQAHPLATYFDSIGDSTSNGIPIGLLGFKSAHNSVEALIPIQQWETTKDKANCLGSSFLYESDNQSPWMSHSFVCSVDGWVLVGCHASPHVLSLDVTRSVYYESQFALTEDKVQPQQPEQRPIEAETKGKRVSDVSVISVRDFRKNGVIGLLGYPLGTVVRVTGEVLDGESTKLKKDLGKSLLQIQSVNGDSLAKPVLLEIARAVESATHLKPGDKFDLYVHEFGAFDGAVELPRELKTVGSEIATDGFYYRPQVTIHEVLK